MRDSEIKSVLPASVFVLFFGACFIIALIYGLATNLQMVPDFSAAIVYRLKGKLALLRPIPRSVAYALAAGLVAGIGGTLLALVYNVFAGILGGIRADIAEREK